MTRSGQDPYLRILPDSVVGTTEVTGSTTPTTLIDEPDETIIEASGTNRDNLTVNIQSTANAEQEIGVGDIRVYEDETPQEVGSVEVSGGTLDLVFVFDDTGSMADEIGAMQTGVKDLTTSVAQRDIDVRYALVSFKNEPEVDIPFTRDSQELKRAVNRMQAEGGGDAPEDNFGAIMTALGLDLRGSAQTVFINITDSSSHYHGESAEEHPHMDRVSSAVGDFIGFTGDSDYTLDEVASALAEADVDFIAVAPDFDHQRCSSKTLAGVVDGMWTDISKRSFDRVLNRIIALITETYHVSYHRTGDASGRVSVRVEYDDPKAGTLSDTVQMRRSTSGTSASGSGTASNERTERQQSTTSSTSTERHSGATEGTPARSSTNAGETLAKFCPSCGHDLRSYDAPAFCPECGIDIGV